MCMILTSEKTSDPAHTPKRLRGLEERSACCFRCFHRLSGLRVVDRIVFDADLGNEVDFEPIERCCGGPRNDTCDSPCHKVAWMGKMIRQHCQFLLLRCCNDCCSKRLAT